MPKFSSFFKSSDSSKKTATDLAQQEFDALNLRLLGAASSLSDNSVYSVLETDLDKFFLANPKFLINLIGNDVFLKNSQKLFNFPQPSLLYFLLYSPALKTQYLEFLTADATALNIAEFLLAYNTPANEQALVTAYINLDKALLPQDLNFTIKSAIALTPEVKQNLAKVAAHCESILPALSFNNFFNFLEKPPKKVLKKNTKKDNFPKLTSPITTRKEKMKEKKQKSITFNFDSMKTNLPGNTLPLSHKGSQKTPDNPHNLDLT